jgi:hypothetical protein
MVRKMRKLYDNNFKFSALSVKTLSNANKIAINLCSILKLNLSSKDSLKNILLNLYVCYKNNYCLSIYLDMTYWYDNGIYKKLHMNYETYRHLFTILESNDYIEISLGKNSYNGKKGYSTKIFNKEKMNKIFELNDIPEIFYSTKHIPTKLIILRNEDKENIEYTHTDITRKHEEDVIRFNSFMAIHKVESNALNLNNSIYCYRIFNKDFTHGGRFYFLTQNLPKDLNGKKPIMAIDGDKDLCELDFKSLHPNLTLNFLGIKCSSELYDAPNVDRARVKLFVLICFNSKNISQAAKAYRYHSIENNIYKKGDFELICDFYKNKFPKLYNEFFLLTGPTIQFHDSNIMNSIMQGCIDKKIPMIPYHDSIVIRAAQKEKALKIMSNAYTDYVYTLTGKRFKPIIEEK